MSSELGICSALESAKPAKIGAEVGYSWGCINNPNSDYPGTGMSATRIVVYLLNKL
jgi:hypothetical protein